MANVETSLFDGYSVDLLDELGRGGFGTVHPGRDPNKRPVAIKKIKRNERGAAKEALTLQELKNTLEWHSNITQIHDVKYYRGCIWIVMEICDLGDLDKYFGNNFNLIDIGLKLNITNQTMSGLTYLHGQNIVHRDIKPKNILVASPPEQPVIKIADFGLCKILGSDESSTMSSNVGTLLFKAPEFFDRHSNDRVRYHRNVDVYAAGLTILAMLQAQKGRDLAPEAEGSNRDSGIDNIIGLRAQKRIENQQPSLTIVEYKPTDDILVRQLKAIIRGMTQVWPQSRLSSWEVQGRLQAMYHGMKLTVRYNVEPENEFKPQAMCISGNLIIVRGYFTGLQCAFNAFDLGSGQFVAEWPIHCQHYPPVGSLVPVGSQGELVLESCPKCAVTRCHNVIDREVTTPFGDQILNMEKLLSNLNVLNMCAGPNETILALTPLYFIHLLKWSNQEHDARMKLRVFNAINPDKVVGMSYFPQDDIVVVASNSPASLKAFKLSSEEIIWEHIVSIGDIPLHPRNVSRSLSQEWVCVANGNNALILKPSDGSFFEKILEGQAEDISSALLLANTFVTMQSNGVLTVYDVSRQQNENDCPGLADDMDDLEL